MDRMSHELRTPMNGVVGMTELLERTALSTTQARLTQTIRSSSQVLLQIVNDLLDLSKIQAGKVALDASARSGAHPRGVRRTLHRSHRGQGHRAHRPPAADAAGLSAIRCACGRS